LRLRPAKACGRQIEAKAAGGSRSDLQDPVRPAAAAHSAWRHPGIDPEDSTLAVDEDEIERAAHAKGMDGLAWSDPERVPAHERLATEQASQAVGQTLGP